MGRIEKEKNLVKFWVDGKAKPYVLDVNLGQLIGLRGAVLQNIPSAIVNLAYWADNKTSVLRLISNNYNPRHNKELYSIADKLDAIGYSASVNELSLVRLNLSHIDFKDLAKYIKEHGGDTNLRVYFDEILESRWREKKGLVIDDNLTEDMCHWLYKNCDSNLPKETVQRLAYYLVRGVWEFFDGNRYSMKDYFRDFVKWCRALEVPMEKGDFFRQYINTKRAYLAQQDTLVNKGIAEYQNEKRTALTFEDENFIVVIPMTKEELRVEGERQGNCVGGYGNRIADRQKNVVFIRRKSNPTVPYITCDIYDDSTICQYLTRFNNGVRDELALAFKRAYQQHLSTHWGE